MSEDKKTIIEKETLMDMLNFNFIIPPYQRPYAWTEKEVEQLLIDLSSMENEYYLGDIVGFSRGDNEFEVIDGQQRLLTIYLIQIIGAKQTLNISYQIRESDNKFLECIKAKKENCESIVSKKLEKISENILDNFKYIQEWKDEHKSEWSNVEKKINNDKKIFFTITSLPKHIDLARYFEVMNSRGKQLENHEVLKARMLQIINNDERYIYAQLWNYCSDMRGKVIEDLVKKRSEENDKQGQKINNKTLLNNILEYYGKIMEGNLAELDKFVKMILRDEQKNNGSRGESNDPLPSDKSGDMSDKEDNCDNILTLRDIIKNGKGNSERSDQTISRELDKDFIIAFPIFLLHTLKIFRTLKNNCSKIEVSLDDKNLLKIFDENMMQQGNEDDIKQFIFLMCILRILADEFVIKKDIKKGGEYFTIDNKSIADSDSGKQLLQLQLLFYFTSPNRPRQEWLSVALMWLLMNVSKFYIDPQDGRREIDININDFIDFLENFDRKLAIQRLIIYQEQYQKKREETQKKNTNSNPKGLVELINKEIVNVCKNDDKEQVAGEETDRDYVDNKNDDMKADFCNDLDVPCDKQNTFYELRHTILNQGTSTPHYWFYRLEYLLWKEWNDKCDEFIRDRMKLSKDIRVKDKYRLSWRNSIEHIFARNLVSDDTPEWKKCVDCFGNLALITQSTNSRLLDQVFEKKKADVKNQLEKGTIESLKMILIYAKYDDWNISNCIKHYKETIALLLGDICNLPKREICKEDGENQTTNI